MRWIRTKSRKIRIAVAIIAGALLIGFVVRYAVRDFGFTAGERSAAKTALQKIDAMQGALSTKDQDYGDCKRAAEDAIRVAEKAAASERDRSMLTDLNLYFFGVENERFIKVIEPRLIEKGALHRKGDAKIDALIREKSSRSRTELHWQLD